MEKLTKLTCQKKLTIDVLIEARAVKDINHLSRIEQVNINSYTKEPQITHRHCQDSAGLEGTQIMFDEDLQCWRLVTQGGAADDTDKKIFMATGTIGSMDLPPILKETP